MEDKKGKIKISINGREIEAEEGWTILDVARENEIDIPALCQHPDLKIGASCRVCVVKIKGASGLKTACSTKIREGMEITTDSPDIQRARQTNLELIFAQHIEECHDCIWRYRCRLLELAKKYQVKIARFPDRKRKCPVYQFGPAFIFDSTKCIDCRNCADVCERQGIGFYEVEGRGAEIKIIPSEDERKECIYCGQCVVHCPAGAFEGVGEFEEIEKPLLEKGKVVVFQIAPAARVSLGEEFGLPYGEIVTEKLVGAVKKLGVNKVFDTSLGADVTTMEEAGELIERLERGDNLPIFTSCCPGWVRYAEFYHPEILPFLTTVRSPHVILGGLVKTYWAEKEGINPKNIVVVSVMPCIAKKYEITRPELEVDGLRPVDYVLTTRELAFLLKKKNIDLTTAEPGQFDDPLGAASGAGVIYGASGGVMEAALRTACAKITGQEMPPLELAEARGIKGLRRAEIKIGERTVKVVVASGISCAKKVLEELKANPRAYDYVEVMACPGGCIGGGGQPVPNDNEIKKQRAAGLYKIDVEKGEEKETRLAHQNPTVKEIYRTYLTEKEKIRKICHTGYSQKKKGEIRKYYL